jgi:ABC-type hemin transport system ATPase subunit
LDEADAYCDRISLMHRGKIRVTGSPASSVGAVRGLGRGARVRARRDRAGFRFSWK